VDKSFEMEIHEASSSLLDSWLSLRVKLWQPVESDDYEQEIKDQLASKNNIAFLVYEPGAYVGFAEVAIRDYADGCDTRNVGYLEGIYIEPAFRKQGFAKALIKKAEAWALQQGCSEMASDAEIDNHVSIRLHEAAGFEALKPAVRFAKKLK
jgi:aminoglycoside 6'-N-acetyltransferase I